MDSMHFSGFSRVGESRSESSMGIREKFPGNLSILKGISRHFKSFHRDFSTVSEKHTVVLRGSAVFQGFRTEC